MQKLIFVIVTLCVVRKTFGEGCLDCAETCNRTCEENDSRKCYFKLVLEHYVVLGAGCPNIAANESSTGYHDPGCVPANGVERTFFAVNKSLPGPTIEVCENDIVIVDVVNQLFGNEVTIHWHGIPQYNTPFYDGVPYVTQCPIHEGNTFRYKWKAKYGTHFYHSHTGFQKLDGIYGSLIVHPLNSSRSKVIHKEYYEHELQRVIMISDWLHTHALERYPGRLDTNIGQRPDSLLINGKGKFFNLTGNTFTKTPLETFVIKPKQEYLFRMINAFSTICPSRLTIENHKLKIIATDGEPIHPVYVDSIISYSGERYDFVVYANQTIKTYWIKLDAVTPCDSANLTQFAYLRYETDQENVPDPSFNISLPEGKVLNPLDGVCSKDRNDAVCISHLHSDNSERRNFPNVPDIYTSFRFYSLSQEEVFKNTNPFLVVQDGSNAIAVVNNISHKSPTSPLVTQYNDIPEDQFCPVNREDSNPILRCINVVKLKLNSYYDFVIIDEVQVPGLSHPFHLHGHSFWVLAIGRINRNGTEERPLRISQRLVRQEINNNNIIRNYLNPPLKDTIAIPNNGYAIIRVEANNPGFWLFHCHFLYHILIGMNFILQVGEIENIPKAPANFPKCGDFVPDYCN